MLDYGVIIMMYLLTQLTPTNKNLTLTVSNDAMSEKIILNYDAKAKKWSSKEGENVTLISVDKKNKIFVFGNDKMSINKLIADDAKINWKTTTSVNVPERENMLKQSPIIIKRNKNSIQLYQKEGDMDRLKNTTINW